ncbi:hypothetical protein E2C01_066471 [Portunus trituberculatus]|uniref:Uncharacterized protein n=1 Tax=Portunus trituberculatus TaxID=210409 RepID=A0A5B7HSE8_PORTR|nr:hypothetical protein [Portunus trituberculatus]
MNIKGMSWCIDPYSVRRGGPDPKVKGGGPPRRLVNTVHTLSWRAPPARSLAFLKDFRWEALLTEQRGILHLVK